MSDFYVHGYTSREAQRLGDQAGTLAELLHQGTHYPAGAKVLEAGCGIGAQTRFLVEGSPEAHFTCLDISPESLAQAEAQAKQRGWDNISFVRGDLYDPSFAPASFDHLFVCFVRRTIIPMVLGVRDQALEAGMMSPEEWDQGIAQLHQAATAQGSFLYTFFKGVGRAACV